jgi:hypothetical protein
VGMPRLHKIYLGIVRVTGSRIHGDGCRRRRTVDLDRTS